MFYQVETEVSGAQHRGQGSVTLFLEEEQLFFGKGIAKGDSR